MADAIELAANLVRTACGSELIDYRLAYNECQRFADLMRAAAVFIREQDKMLAAARRDVATLRGALEPFADYGRPCKISGTLNFHDLEDDVCVATNSGLAITAGDCRRAAAALAATAPKEDRTP